MIYRAYAKINLGLRVLHKRPDGYHEIETIFQQIDLFDTLQFSSRRQGIHLSCDSPDLPTDKGNLVYRAAELLQRQCKTMVGCKIYLQKKIPMGAGLGGGSSDAAATLKALNQLWSLNMSQDQLQQLASQLGADVPFFIRGGSALAKGRGEILQPISLPTDYYGVLIYPNISISTKWVYENGTFDLTNTIKNSKFYSLSSFIHEPMEWQEHLNNDLQPIVFNRFPFLHSILQQLKEEGAFYTSMSGSGSSLFGLFAYRQKAERALEKINTNYTRLLFRPVADSQ